MSLVSDVRQLVDEAAGPVWWTNQQLYDNINQVLLEVWGFIKPWQYVTTTMSTTAGQDITLFPSALVMVPQYLIDPQNNKLLITNHAQLQDYSPNWRNQPQAQPHWAIQWDAYHLRFFPTPDQTYVFTLAGIPWPPIIADGLQDITLDPMIKQCVEHRAVGYLLQETQPELSAQWIADSLEHEQRFFRQIRNSMGANTWRLRPGKGWRNAQQGDIKMGKKFFPIPKNPYG